MFLLSELLFHTEKNFIVNSSSCFKERNYVVNQYWFVPDKAALEYEKIVPVNAITYEDFTVYDYELNKEKSLTARNEEFAENIKEFINKLSNNPKAEGFIIHNSNSKKMKRDIGKVNAVLIKESVDLQRVKTIVKTRLEGDKNGKLRLIKNDRNSYPSLAVLSIKE